MYSFVYLEEFIFKWIENSDNIDIQNLCLYYYEDILMKQCKAGYEKIEVKIKPHY